MVLVTELQYGMDQRLINKLDLMIQRCVRKNPKLDTLLLVEGGEGTGKTTMSVDVAKYVSFKTGRPFTNNNIFFKADKLLEFAQATDGQIIIYDEPALDMLSAQWWKKEQQNLIKLLMTARKKRHFIILNITKFYKFPEYIIVDRAVGMIHTYAKEEMYPGRFVYIKKKNLEYLFNSYRSSKRRLYKKYSAFRGTFPDMLDKIIDADAYNKNKDEAILSIGKDSMSMKEAKYEKLKKQIALIEGIPQEAIAKALKISVTTLQRWKQMGMRDEYAEIEAPVPL